MPEHCTRIRCEQLEKAEFSIDERRDGNTNKVKPEQPQKAHFLILVSSAGKIKEPVKPEQPENALSPMKVSPGGMVKGPVKPEQSKNAWSPMKVRSRGKVKGPDKPEQP